MSPATKFSFSSLPLIPKAQCLQYNLTPDPLTPSHKAFGSVLSKNPSVQRRARLIDPAAQFSFVTPFHLPFPYRIQPPKEEKEVEVDKAGFVERWLSAREPLEPRSETVGHKADLLPHSSKERDSFPARNLLGLSPTGLRDCLPHLDVGRAFESIGKPSLFQESCPLPPTNKSDARDPIKDDTAAEELIDVLGGHTVLMRFDDEGEKHTPYFPWSLRYSGHQFGVWAGQLGDGRAISIRMSFLSFMGRLRYSA
jgi:hypothetical protein